MERSWKRATPSSSTRGGRKRCNSQLNTRTSVGLCVVSDLLSCEHNPIGWTWVTAVGRRRRHHRHALSKHSIPQPQTVQTNKIDTTNRWVFPIALTTKKDEQWQHYFCFAIATDITKMITHQQVNKQQKITLWKKRKQWRRAFKSERSMRKRKGEKRERERDRESEWECFILNSESTRIIEINRDSSLMGELW